MGIVANIKFSSNLKNSSSANGYYFYTNRYDRMTTIGRKQTFTVIQIATF